MSEPVYLDRSQLPDISKLVLEDDTPLDSFINEKQPASFSIRRTFLRP
jgi:hypothetical protein